MYISKSDVNYNEVISSKCAMRSTYESIKIQAKYRVIRRHYGRPMPQKRNADPGLGPRLALLHRPLLRVARQDRVTVVSPTP